jgi:hypothetical protein
MKKMDDNKNIIIFILVIFVLFFISNDKNFNKIFNKNIIKILFLVTLVYMVYLKVNLCIILAIFFIFILFNTNVGKKLQKNKYIKRIIKYFSPYVNPIIYSIEDFVYSFTNIPDDDSSVGSIKNKRVRFQNDEVDENDIDYDNIDDIELLDDKHDENDSSTHDLLDEIRQSMIPENAYENNKDEESSTPINTLEDIDEVEEENSNEITKLSPTEARELYNEMNLIKSQLNIN